MQVTIPHDLETTLRADLAAILGDDMRVYMPPLPPELCTNGVDVVIYPVGGDSVSAASDRYDVSIDVYAPDTDTLHDAVVMVRAAVTQLPLASGTTLQYNAANAGIPYDNYDPRAPELYRMTFRAALIVPGAKELII